MTTTFADLRSKYEEMRALRVAEVSLDPQPRMAALAERFPGALREIDELPLQEIEARIEVLLRAERDPDTAPRWIHAMTRFHALARGVLYIKRALAEGRTHASMIDDGPDEAHAWRTEIARIENPPRGRLMNLVYERLASELALTPTDAKNLVFTSSRST